MLRQISCPIFFQNIVPKSRIPARREDFFAPRRSFCLPAAAEPGEFRIFVSKGPEGLHDCPGAGHQTKPTRMNRILTLIASCLLLASCAGKNRYDLVPYPNHLTPRPGTFTAAGAAFVGDERMDDASRAALEAFAARLAEASQGENPVRYAADPAAAEGFRFVVDESLAAERYLLDVSRRSVTVRASALPGFLYAIQTLRQLLPPAICGGEGAAEWVIPCVEIDDAPRFAYRGLMLDVARHFFDAAQVKKILDVMAFHKLNTLHWHLTDDQGWRIEIRRYPRLTEYGSIRKGTVVGKNWDQYDGIPYGGYYTQEEIRDVVAYAAARGITVIPEIDLPGHMVAALACYPELGCTGGPYEVWGRWGVADDVLCVGQEKTFEFLEGVLTEVMELFPSEYIHIGGDECPKVRWEKCPRCQAKIRELGLRDDDRHQAEHYLQSYVTARIEKFLNAHGRRIIGWDEILEGELAPDATVMSWRGSDGGIAAAKLGHDAIMTPTTHFYFDYYQARDTENEPFGIGGYVPVERVYAYEPLADTLPQELRSHILGVQANLWTEYIATPEHQEYMLLPRMAALSEVQWCDPGRREWTRFAAAMPHIVDLYGRMGYNYATVLFGVTSSLRNVPEKGCVEVTLSTVGDAPIHYTLDGGDPTAESPRYTAPLEIRDSCTLKAIALREGVAPRLLERTFSRSKALGHAIELNTLPMGKYTFGAPESLVDGIESSFSYANGDWAGWYGDPMSVTIDMNGATYGEVRLGTLVLKGEDIFPPLDLAASTSDDGEHFTEVGRIEIPMETAADPEGLKSYTVRFPETSARYLRVEARTVNPIPDWHGARGKRGFLFVDEICVN